MALKLKHYLQDADLKPQQIQEILELSASIKKYPERFRQELKNKTVAILFEKLSLRTKFTLQIGVNQMGGYSVVNDGNIPDREPVKDIARNLSRWVDLVVARVYSQKTLEELAKYSSIPVVNALSDLYHPCQILADMFTLQEHFGSLKGLNLAFIGDGNNVANSLILTSASLGLNFRIATPKNYEPSKSIIRRAKALNLRSHGALLVTNNPKEAAIGAQAIYTDTWVSMGQEKDAAKRVADFKNYQVREKLFKYTDKKAVFMHCLPKHPNQEVTEKVFESKRSVVFEQAENRLHTIKAVLKFLVDINKK